MNGRVALITGAGRGIGLGIARLLAQHGCAVAIQDIDLDVAKEAALGITKSGGRAIALGGDILEIELAETLIEESVRQLGGFHVLVNNAAIQEKQDWLTLTPEQIERTWRANLLAPFLLAQGAARIFIKQRWGRIINLGSIQGKSGNAEMLPYSMSKAAVVNMTTGLAKELASDGITVNTIAPGYFNTWRNRDDFKSAEDLETRARWVPMKRVGAPEDCAGVVLLLCSDEGSYITGQTIYVDGGLSAK